MNVKYNLINNIMYIYLDGELDECTALKTREIIDGLTDRCGSIDAVVFNLTNLVFMDSTGIGMMIGRYKKLKSKSIKVYVQNPSVTVEKILELSGLYQIMPKI